MKKFFLTTVVSLGLFSFVGIIGATELISSHAPAVNPRPASSPAVTRAPIPAPLPAHTTAVPVAPAPGASSVPAPSLPQPIVSPAPIVSEVKKQEAKPFYCIRQNSKHQTQNRITRRAQGEGLLIFRGILKLHLCTRE